MRVLAIGGLMAALSASVAVAAAAPAPAPAAPLPLKEFASSAEIQELIERARRLRTNEPTYVQPLLSLAPYRASLEYRAAEGPASLHEDRAELFYVLEGQANLVTGGKLIGQQRTNATNLSGSGIEGGFARRVKKGDLIIVPEKTAHQFVNMTFGPIVVISMHVPRS